MQYCPRTRRSRATHQDNVYTRVCLYMFANTHKHNTYNRTQTHTHTQQRRERECKIEVIILYELSVCVCVDAFAYGEKTRARISLHIGPPRVDVCVCVFARDFAHTCTGKTERHSRAPHNCMSMSIVLARN